MSRGTIAALYHDRATKVDLRVVEKLCKVLKCNAGDLFVYVPDEEDEA
ncbi:MAG: Transcriptional regulator, Cro/CI family [Thermoanaerobacterales bacterium 50_218]|nr:MAG: Transcriptional regulator, Cro/CI family [Thermoanaerobacterales bacterium 50_218]HAA90151.1 Cro/Cl family transcriptional regulator [Peptococcaceae bacterium]